MAIAGLVISILVISLSVFIYILHDCKIKNQTKIINDYQLQKNEKENIEEKKAILKTVIHKEKNGERVLIILNNGKVTATNVEIKFSDNKNLKILNNPCPINIEPTNNINISLFISEFCPNILDFTITWKDEFSDENIEPKTLQI